MQAFLFSTVFGSSATDCYYHHSSSGDGYTCASNFRNSGILPKAEEKHGGVFSIWRLVLVFPLSKKCTQLNIRSSVLRTLFCGNALTIMLIISDKEILVVLNLVFRALWKLAAHMSLFDCSKSAIIYGLSGDWSH